jgi:tetratricopeptide (TPR) repeat protein
MKVPLHLATMIMMSASINVQAAGYCGELTNAYGPFDYAKRNEFAQNFYLIESAHFTPEVEKLIKGSSSYLGGDLDYTLRAVPNHHRALASIAKLGLRDKTTRVPGTKWSVECYFDRAIRFRPDDAGVRNLYGGYLYKLGRINEAIEQLTEAVRLDPENATANHNLGLIYLQEKDYDKAVLHAKKADALGFPLPGLKNKLSEMGKWDATPNK